MIDSVCHDCHTLSPWTAIGTGLTTLALITTLVIGLLGLTGWLDSVTVATVNLACYSFTGLFLLTTALKKSLNSDEKANWMAVAMVIFIFVPIIIGHSYGVAGLVGVDKLAAFPITVAITGGIFTASFFLCGGCLWMMNRNRNAT